MQLMLAAFCAVATMALGMTVFGLALCPIGGNPGFDYPSFMAIVSAASITMLGIPACVLYWYDKKYQYASKCVSKDEQESRETWVFSCLDTMSRKLQEPNEATNQARAVQIALKQALLAGAGTNYFLEQLVIQEERFAVLKAAKFQIKEKKTLSKEGRKLEWLVWVTYSFNDKPMKTPPIVVMSIPL